jgi:hypothetical protein
MRQVWLDAPDASTAARRWTGRARDPATAGAVAA